MTECDKPPADNTADLVVKEFTDDGDDVHFCKRCKEEFTSLHSYLEHKIQHDNFKVTYSRSTKDRRVIYPKLVQRVKLESRKEDRENKDGEKSVGKENQTGYQGKRRGRRGRQKVPEVDEGLITEKVTYTCEKCNKTFNRDAALRRHVKYDHEMNDDDDDDEDGEGEAYVSADDGPDYKRPRLTSSDKADRPHMCHTCGHSFKEVNVLKTHMLTHTNKREFTCKFAGCTYAFKTKGSLKRHMRRHTGERPYTCSMCRRCFTESGALSRHLKSRTSCTVKTDADLPRYGKRWDFLPNIPAAMGNLEYSDINGLTNPADTELKSQKLTDVVNQYVQNVISNISDGISSQDSSQIEPQTEVSLIGECESTGNTELDTINVTVATSHISSDDPDDSLSAVDKQSLKPTQCRVCIEDFGSLEALRVHLRTHLADTPFRCSLCHFVAEKRDTLNQHMLNQHKTELTGVERALVSPNSLDAQDEVEHSWDKYRTCRDARIAVEQLLELKDDAEVQASNINGGRPFYKCHVCLRSFRGSTYLRLHLRSHTGERPHKCLDCDKTFTTKDILNKHMSTHSDERNYKCGECGKLFKRISHVREHLKIHSGMRPFPCAVCDKTFKTANALKVHHRIHTDVLPYECKYCHRHFREKGSLQRHIRMHTGERPFHCKYCGRGFAEHGTLNRHLKAKVPCTKQLDTKDVDLRDKSTYPTLLAEFSSVVADTQQYILSETGEPEPCEEAAEYVVVHTDMAADVVQNVEIITDSSVVESAILGTTDVPDEPASYVVVSESREDNVHLLDSTTSVAVMQSQIASSADCDDIHTLAIMPEENEIRAIAMAPDQPGVDAIQRAMIVANVVEQTESSSPNLTAAEEVLIDSSEKE